MNSQTKSRWGKLEKTLRSIYKEEHLGNKIEADLKYLDDAYSITEELWINQLNVMIPKFIMLSEAPLFGKSKNYFYNPNTPLSPFCRFNDAESVAGKDFSLGRYFGGAKEKKNFLIETLTDNGFLILDLFPFALNQTHTALNYQQINRERYLRLFKESIDNHLNEKLDQIKHKCKKNYPLFFFRYKRLKVHLEQDVKGALVKQGLLNNDSDISSIGSDNMWIDREKLKLLVMMQRENNV